MVVVQGVGSLIGLGLVGMALFDMLATTVAVSVGKGPVTARVARWIWGRLLAVHERRRSHRLLAWGGPVVLLAILLMWLGLLVAGWALVFQWPGALIGSEEGAATSVLSHLFFSASLVIGRGSPNYIPDGEVWQLATQVAGLSGLGLLSLSIAYILMVVDAVVHKRKVASYISALGHTVDQLVGRAWNGQDFGILRLHLIPLTAKISEAAENHLAYPVVHYFHSIERHTALAPSIAVLDDTLTMLECCRQDDRLEPSTIVPLRAAISELLQTLNEAFVVTDEQAGPPPDVESLRQSGLPLQETEVCTAVFERVQARRRLLRALVVNDGWSWDALSQGAWEDSAMLGRDRANPDPDTGPFQIQ